MPGRQPNFRRAMPQVPAERSSVACPGGAQPDMAASTLSVLAQQIAEMVAARVVNHLRATELPGYVDQSASPLGRRRHIAAVRNGSLPGIRVGRRYLARHEDVDAYVARRSTTKERGSGAADTVDGLARELGLAGR